jgi:cbb3-type cytochrome oxidase maturation protein
VVVALIVLGALALAAFAWAWWRGQFTRLDRQAFAVLEPRDLRLERPWETPAQRRERSERFGLGEAPRPGEWGGAV